MVPVDDVSVSIDAILAAQKAFEQSLDTATNAEEIAKAINTYSDAEERWITALSALFAAPALPASAPSSKLEKLVERFEEVHLDSNMRLIHKLGEKYDTSPGVTKAVKRSYKVYQKMPKPLEQP